MWKHLMHKFKWNFRGTNGISKSFQFCTFLHKDFRLNVRKTKLTSRFQFTRTISSHLVLCKNEDNDSYKYIIDDSSDIKKDEQGEIETEYILPKIKPMFGHNIFVIQPRVKWGRKKKRNTTPDLQLAEAVTLAETIPHWVVAEKVILNCVSLDKKFLFGTGNLKILKGIISCNATISAVFISIHMLTVLQRKSLEKEFQLPVYDRYMVVLHIFQDHARTKQAKLQIALAEIPYLRSKIQESEDLIGLTGFGRSSKGHISGSGGESFTEIQQNFLKKREQKIIAALDQLTKQRTLLRKNRLAREFPTVAIVGYTNSGKTSLIKALTGDTKLEPKDQLFATLDVTTHAGRLFSFQKLLYIDTIGFISDIPTTLIESFASTLEDMILADLIVHVRDVSHPDHVAQKENVLNTLESLNLPSYLLDSIIEVGNKVDLLKENEREKDLLYVSATKFSGLDVLKKMIEKSLMENTGRIVKIFRVPSGGTEMRWLYKEANIKATMADTTDPNFLLMEVVISQAVLSKYIHHFGNSAINQ